MSRAGETEVIGYVDPTDVDDWVLAIGGDGTPENPGLPPNPNPEQDVVIQLHLSTGDYGEPRTVLFRMGTCWKSSASRA